MTRWSARQGAGQEGFNAKHVATSTLWAVTQRPAGQQLVAVTVVERHIRNLDHGGGFGEQLPAEGQLGRAVAVGQEAVMPNPLKPVR